jgi:glycosyltransferase involved in cell wall biosynthesis
MTTPPIRILGFTMEPVGDFRAHPNAKNAGLYAALDRRYRVTEILRPKLSQLETNAVRLAHFHPNVNAWRQRANLNFYSFKRRTLRAEQLLRQREGSYDLIMQLHTVMAPGTAHAQRRYALHTDNCYLSSERHYPEWAPLRGSERDEWVRWERSVYQNAAFLFPRSQFLRRALIEDYGCDPERVIAVGGGVSLSLPSIAEKRYDGQIALFVGTDFKRKGGEVLLDAWQMLRPRFPEAQLWIVGPQKPTRALPGVKWFGKITDRKALSDLYLQASMFVMPSLFEPWGFVFYEAMGHGLACIGADSCAMPEMIGQGENGLLVPPGEPEPLADALARLFDPAAAEAMGRRAYTHALAADTWDHVVGRMAPYIEQAVGETKGALR